MLDPIIERRLVSPFITERRAKKVNKQKLNLELTQEWGTSTKISQDMPAVPILCNKRSLVSETIYG